MDDQAGSNRRRSRSRSRSSDSDGGADSPAERLPDSQLVAPSDADRKHKKAKKHKKHKKHHKKHKKIEGLDDDEIIDGGDAQAAEEERRRRAARLAVDGGGAAVGRETVEDAVPEVKIDFSKGFVLPPWAIEPQLKEALLVEMKDSRVVTTYSIGRDKARLFGRAEGICNHILGHQSISRQHAAIVHTRAGRLVSSSRV